MGHRNFYQGDLVAGVKGHYERGIYAPLSESIRGLLGEDYASFGFGVRRVDDPCLRAYAKQTGFLKALQDQGATADDFAALLRSEAPVKGVVDVYLVPKQSTDESESTFVHLGVIPFTASNVRDIRAAVTHLSTVKKGLEEMAHSWVERTVGIGIK